MFQSKMAATTRFSPLARCLWLSCVQNRSSTLLMYWSKEQRPFNLADFSQCYGEPILTWIGSKFAEHQRCCNRAVLDRRGETQNVVPVAGNLFPIHVPADERLLLSK